MILIPLDAAFPPPPPRLPWDTPAASVISGTEEWARATRRVIEVLRDEQNHRLPLREELWLSVFPPRGDGQWRAEADDLGPAVVGRGATAEKAVGDWTRRFRMTFQRALELRPFEMTPEDLDLWARVQRVIDVPRYKATKPMLVRQVGKVHKSRGGLTVVEWEDGAKERVNPKVFDEAFARFRVGQPFEAIVTRDPLTFRLIRAEAVRKLPGTCAGARERSRAIWDRAVGPVDAASAEPPPIEEVDEDFWLTPSE